MEGDQMKDIVELADLVRQTAFNIHCYHKNGHLEKVYENALAHRLRKAGLEVKQQHPLKVYHEDGKVIGDWLPHVPFCGAIYQNRFVSRRFYHPDSESGDDTDFS